VASVLLKGVTKAFGKTLAVRNIDLEVPDKQFAVLVGPSGCGKTTILRLVAGLEELSSGEVYIGERLVNDVPPKDRNVAMVFQNYALYPHMNVYRNMAIGLQLRKLGGEEIDQRVREAANMLGLTKLLDRKPAALSGGERQRVAMGRAMVRKPDLFLFDEPLSNLDAKLRVRMRTEIKKLHALLETTVIYVTHDQVEAMTLADEIVVMNNGTITQKGLPLNVYRNPQNLFVAGFIGAPPMNFLKVRLSRVEGSLRLTAQGIDLGLPEGKSRLCGPWINRELILGVRPEQLYPATREQPQQNYGRIEGVVGISEPLGSETLIHLKAGDQEFVAMCDPDTVPVMDSKMSFLIDMDKTHLFDPENESSII
jgi:multiple sugar transport system ATP-binding protein